jgi:acid phosphatase
VRILIAAAIAIAAAATAHAAEPKAPAQPGKIDAYHDSGESRVDTARQIRRARRFLRRHLDDRRPAIVLDIDDTSLSNYACLKAVDFDRGAAACSDLPAIPHTLRMYRYARRHGVKVFFITGRREHARADTRANLRAEGYRIVVNVGDQRSDLDGGRALRRIRLPNPMYVIERA